MPQAYKVLGQISPSANTLTTLYAAPSATQAVVSTILVCNQNSTPVTYRLAVRPAGASIATQHYLAFDSVCPANDTITLTIGISVGATDVISVQANATSTSFHAYGAEIT